MQAVGLETKDDSEIMYSGRRSSFIETSPNEHRRSKSISASNISFSTGSKIEPQNYKSNILKCLKVFSLVFGIISAVFFGVATGFFIHGLIYKEISEIVGGTVGIIFSSLVFSYFN